MNPIAIENNLTAENSATEAANVEQLDAIRDLADLELLCVGGGSGDVIF